MKTAEQSNQNNLIVKNSKRKTIIKLLNTNITPSYLKLKSKNSFVKKYYHLILHILYQSGENRSCKSIELDTMLMLHQ